MVYAYRRRPRVPKPQLSGDKQVVLAAVTENGLALERAGKFRADKDIVLAAVTQNCNALKYALLNMQADREVVQTAIERCPDAWNYLCTYQKRDLRRLPEVQAALIPAKKAINKLKQLGRRRATSEAMQNSLDYAIALIAKRFGKSVLVSAERAVDMLKQLGRRRPTSESVLNSLDDAIALIAKRFGDDATIQDVAQEASAELHNPWTKSGHWCLSHKRDRAAFEGDMWSASTRT